MDGQILRDREKFMAEAYRPSRWERFLDRLCDFREQWRLRLWPWTR
jgi:hypothetical protein